MQSKSKQMLYLSKSDVIAAGLTMAEIIDSMEVMFRAKGEGRTEMPPKPGIYPGGGSSFLHAMPACIPDLKSAGIKWVAAFPDNPSKGLPYISGLIVYNDFETGLPLAVMDCVWVTAKRTGASSAISARHLARPDSSVMGMLGCGVQGRSHVEGMKELFPISRVMAYDVNEQAKKQFASEIGGKFDLEVVPVESPREAVSGCDIVVTAGPMTGKPHATIQAGWLNEGAFASLVDYDYYWQPAAMHEADKFCTDDRSQFESTRQGGHFPDIPEVHADLGELATGQKTGRETPAERTMTANLGLALNDMAVAPLIYEKAKEKGIGTWLEL
jgi:ornithine cyclodeaminase/alanine dehydrogenase